MNWRRVITLSWWRNLFSFLVVLSAILAFSLLVYETYRSNRQTSKQPANRAFIEQERKRAQPCINLNTATSEQLQLLPGIGSNLAGKIIDYRQRHGPFRRPEQIIIIEGISERKYRAISELICIE
jgi:competence ComEA-like helix-hairpin-helix protein